MQIGPINFSRAAGRRLPPHLSCIYLIRNMINGRQYIGSTNNVQGRYAEHRRNLKLGRHFNNRLQKDWLKYGSEFFEFISIEIIYRKSELLNREQFYLDNWKNHYNISKVAGVPYIYRGQKSPEHLAAIKAAWARRPKSKFAIDKERREERRKNALAFEGKTFGKLYVDSQSVEFGKHGSRVITCYCSCACGNKKIISGKLRQNNFPQSCGCVGKARRSDAQFIHGYTGTKEYAFWLSVRNADKRSLSVCREWKNSIQSFLKDIGPKPDKMVLGRKNLDFGYWCGHCDECLIHKRPFSVEWMTQGQIRQMMWNKRRAKDIKYGENWAECH